MKNSHNIQQIFTDWGKKQHEFPANNQEMKAKTMAVFQANAPSFAKATEGKRPWFSIAFAVLAGLVFIMNSGAISNTVQVADVPVQRQTIAETDSSIANQTFKGMAPEYYPYQQPTVPATDSREFLKTDYNATIRTRDTQALTRRVETTARGFGGRVDSSSSAQKWGYVSFVVPAGKFEAFRDEIESFMPARFITTEVRTENLLPQVRNVEENGDWFGAQQVVNDVMTVRGTISLQWISIWDVVQLYVSLSWMVWILIGVAFISYLFERRRRFC